MDELITWLREQLNEDERRGFAVNDDAVAIRHGGDTDTAERYMRQARWVLRDADAKRRIIVELKRLPHYAWDGRDEYGCPKYTEPEVWRDVYGEGAEQTCNCGRDGHVDRTLRLLALPYDRRPGYREEWKP